jgi:hypothetical protein
MKRSANGSASAAGPFAFCVYNCFEHNTSCYGMDTLVLISLIFWTLSQSRSR